MPSCFLAAASDRVTLNWIKVCEALYRVWVSRHKPMKHKIVCAHQSGPSHLQFIGGMKSLLENWTEYKQGVGPKKTHWRLSTLSSCSWSQCLTASRASSFSQHSCSWWMRDSSQHCTVSPDLDKNLGKSRCPNLFGRRQSWLALCQTIMNLSLAPLGASLAP